MNGMSHWLLVACAAVALSTPYKAEETGFLVPATVLWDGNLLQLTKQLLNSPASRSALEPALDDLVRWADYWHDEAGANRTFSVLSKESVAPSGNPRHFLSIGTYFWPNRATCANHQNASVGEKICWPWDNNKQELVNPTTFLYDSLTISQMIFAVKNLTLACYFTGNASYGYAAMHFIRAWFLDPVSGMDPVMGLEFAQLVPGLKTGRAGPSDMGRSFGVIDAKDIGFVLDGMALLESIPGATNLVADLHRWFQTYYVWLSGSRHAVVEYEDTNNHGVWYDVQALSIALHLKNASGVEFLSRDALARIALQIAPNGTMKRELGRTRSMHYTWWNLQAFFELAVLAQLGGVDVWHYLTMDGRSLRRALDFVLPYAICDQKWPYEEETPFDHGKFFEVFRLAARKWGNASYEAAIPKLGCSSGSVVRYESSVENLLWPRLTFLETTVAAFV